MTRLNLPAKDVVDAVTDKLQLSNLRRTKEQFGDFCLDGKKQFTVKLPNVHGGNPNLSPGYQKAVRNRLRLTQAQFYDLVRCPMSRKDYENLIRSKLPPGE
jgi:hypothetical protein